MSKKIENRGKRRTANRVNAQLSTGPKNTRATRLNAVRHGLLAEGLTELDCPDTFGAICSKLESQLTPVGELEAFLTKRIALCMVRLKRFAADRNWPCGRAWRRPSGCLFGEQDRPPVYRRPGRSVRPTAMRTAGLRRVWSTFVSLLPPFHRSTAVQTTDACRWSSGC